MTSGVTSSNPMGRSPQSGSEIKKDIGPDDSKKNIASSFKNVGGRFDNVKQLDNGKIVQPDVPNVRNRKATLYTQAPWDHPVLDVSAQSETFKDITFSPPEKPFVEAHSGDIKAGLSMLSAGGGALIGSIVGSAVPIVGTAIGFAVGAVTGVLVGHLIKKYGRSHSDRRRFQKAVDALEKQGVKFTEREKKRLDDMGPDQWKYLNKRRSEIVDHLKRYSEVQSDASRWAKEVFNQYAILNVAKFGYIQTQMTIRDLSKRASKFEDGYSKAAETLSPQALAQEMLGDIDELGGDAFAITRQAKSERSARRKVDATQAAAKQKWQQLKSKFARVFGEVHVKRFENKYARYIELGTHYSFAKTCYENAKYIAAELGHFIKPHLAQYDDEIRNRLSRLVNKYAVDVALGDLEWTHILDEHGNFRRERIEEFINKAERLQSAKDRESGSEAKPRVPPDTAIRRATLPNRLSDYADSSSRDPRDLYDRFVDGAVDLYTECEALLDLPEAAVGAVLAKDHLEPDPLARLNAKNLIELAKLGKELKDKAVDCDTARMLLRLEATERGVKAEMDRRNGDIQNAGQDQHNGDIQTTLAPGWSAQLANSSREAVPETLSWSGRIVSLDGAAPRQDVIDIARQTVADAKKLHETLQTVPGLSGLTLRDAETVMFSLVSKTPRYAVNDCDVWKMLTANNFAHLITILKSGVDAGKTYENLLKSQNLTKGGLSVNDAIECTRLNASADHVIHIRNSPDQTEYAVWRDKGFTDVEIAAYRESLVIWKNESNRLNPQYPQRRDDSGRRLKLTDGKMNFFKGSGLTRSEANQLLWLDLVPESKAAPSPIELRRRSDSKVHSEKVIGTGSHHAPIKRKVRNADGTIDTRVFKELPEFEGNLRPLGTKGLVGSNLGASMINEALGFNAIVHTQLSVRKSRIGISMEMAKGHTALSLQKGEVFLDVPRDEPHYDELNQAVEADLEKYGAISEATRKRAFEKYKFTRLRVVDQKLQAAGDFMKDLVDDADFQRMVTELQIIDFLTDELDRNLLNFLIDVRLGPKGAMAVAVKGIDNDCGFANRLYTPWSIRTPPRVMSRRQADAIKKMYKDRTENGIFSGLRQVVAPSTLHVPVKPDRAFQFQNSRALTAANLKPDRTGDQVALFDERLALLCHHIDAAGDRDPPLHADGAPILTIIDDDEPNKEIKVDLDNNAKDGGAGWGGDEVTKILKNTSSIVATCDVGRP